MLRRFFLIYFLLFLNSCSSLDSIGAIKINNTNIQSRFFYYYIVDKNNIRVEAEIAGVQFFGNIFPIKNFGDPGKSNSILRMNSNGNVQVECFIENYSRSGIRYGGKGVCYNQGRIIFDILLIPTTQEKRGTGFLRFLAI